MKSIFLIPLLCLLINCQYNSSESGRTEKFHPQEADSTSLRYLKEYEWPKAYKTHDTILLHRILGEDFQMIDADGNWFSKEDELEWITHNATSSDSFFYEIKRFEFLENGTVLICGMGHVFQDSTETTYHSSNVLIKRKGTWKAVLSHVSGIKMDRPNLSRQ